MVRRYNNPSINATGTSKIRVTVLDIQIVFISASNKIDLDIKKTKKKKKNKRPIFNLICEKFDQIYIFAHTLPGKK